MVMKKVLSGILALSTFLPGLALAQVGGGQPIGIEPPGWGDVEVMVVLDNVTDWLFALLLITAAIFIILAAFYFVTASGDPDKTKTARNFVLYALIGVLVAFIAKGLVYLIDAIVAG